MGLLFRLYKNEIDKDDIVHMCRNVYGGTDALPGLVSFLAEDERCLPLVATLEREVIAFCNLRLLDSDDDTKDVVLVERIRVSEAVRGKGVGTALVREAMKVSESWCDSERSVRFLSTTVPHNLAMTKIFKTTGWACTGIVEMWPSISVCYKVIETSSNIRGRFLDALQLSKFVPRHAVKSLSSWQKLETNAQIWDTMRCIQSYGGHMLRPGYFTTETVTSAAKLTTGESQNGKHSAWQLKREVSPPILVFFERSCRVQGRLCDLVSACVVDIAGAESCVAFAASRKDLGAFMISFDPSITKDKMKSSNLLSRVETSTFCIYEALS